MPAAFSGANGSLSDYLLLDPPITVMLLMLLSCTLLLGCSPLSMYALNKLSVFLTKSRKKYIRELPSARSYLWSFYPHVSQMDFITHCQLNLNFLFTVYSIIIIIIIIFNFSKIFDLAGGISYSFSSCCKCSSSPT